MITRAPAIINFAYVVTLAAPFVALWAVRLVRGRRYDAHRRVQAWLLAVAVGAVLALELEIRMAGGSAALLAGSRFAGSGLLNGVALVHIAGAVLTYALWIWLFCVSIRKRQGVLPGTFSRTHRRLGWYTIYGLQFTAVSASCVYVMGFVM